MITKITNSSRRITPFGGLFFVINDLRKRGLSKMIDLCLGRRVTQAKYSYSDIVLNWIYCNLCGAERLHDVELLRDEMSDDMILPSSDRIGRIFRSMSLESTVKGIYETNIHEPLNGLMVSIALKLGLLNRKERYTLDYDNTIIEHKKYDRKRTYKMTSGYQPGVSFIDKIPIYIEGRNGNSNANYKITETVERSLDLLEKKGVRLNRFRSDSAAYTISMFRLMEERGIDFFIRARRSPTLNRMCVELRGWETITIKQRTFETKSVEFTTTNDDSSYRMVLYKTEDRDKWRYFSILTNNREMSELEIIRFYNMRGDIERNFDDLKNNFNWHRLPFSFLKENTVFMIISAIASIVYQYLIRKFSKKVDFVKRKHRLKNFIYHFIMCSATFYNGRLKIFTDRDYGPLIE